MQAGLLGGMAVTVAVAGLRAARRRRTTRESRRVRLTWLTRLRRPAPSAQVKETTHDACFLHNEQFFAAAQKRYTYIYDKRGLEVHCLEVRGMLCCAVLCSVTRRLVHTMRCAVLCCCCCTVGGVLRRVCSALCLRGSRPGAPAWPCLAPWSAPVHAPHPTLPTHVQDTTEATRLEFLPHHFLLGSVGSTGVLRYQDTSTGRIVATHRTKQVSTGCVRPLGLA